MLLQAVPKCQQCGLNLPAPLSLCGHCLKSPPAYSYVVSAMDYTEESGSLLQRFKFYYDFAAGRVLAELLAEQLEQTYQNKPWPDLIMPVPLHYKRLWRRGFNQALVLARNLKLSIPIDYKSLKRIRHTPRQVGLSGNWRKRNLAQAFAVSKNLCGQTIAILDDVITTGATVNEIAKVLLKAGAKEVVIWCVLRTQQHH
jgi:ComF family protein